MPQTRKQQLAILKKGRDKLKKMRAKGKARRGKNKAKSAVSLIAALQKQGYKVTKA